MSTRNIAVIRLLDSIAALIISARLLTDDLVQTLDRAKSLVLASALPDVRDLASHRTRELARAAVDEASATVVAFDRALALALADAATTVLLEGALERARAALSSAVYFAAAFDDSVSDTALAHALDDALARVREDTLTRASNNALALSYAIKRIAVDAAGADLTKVAIEDPGALAEVVWSDQTRWPSRLEPWIRQHSAEIGPGLYRVTRGTGRDTLDDLVRS